MSNEYKDWLHDEEHDKKLHNKVLRRRLDQLVPTPLEQLIEDLDKIEIVSEGTLTSWDGMQTCPDCEGGLNAQGKHLDCRTCNNTGLV